MKTKAAGRQNNALLMVAPLLALTAIALALFFSRYGVLVASEVDGANGSAVLSCSYFTGSRTAEISYWHRWRADCPAVHDFDYDPILQHWRVHRWHDEPIHRVQNPRLRLDR